MICFFFGYVNDNNTSYCATNIIATDFFVGSDSLKLDLILGTSCDQLVMTKCTNLLFSFVSLCLPSVIWLAWFLVFVNAVSCLIIVNTKPCSMCLRTLNILRFY